MALTPPTVDDLGTFRHEEFAAGSETEWAGFVLQQATDALWVFTGLEEAPQDPRAARLMNYALMELSLWIMAQDEHRDEINSPFSGERIGSYSYTKMQQAQRGEETGIYWLDLFFRLLRAPGEAAETAWVSSERVFNPEGYNYAEEQFVERLTLRDPSEPWGLNFSRGGF